jgi:hydroxyacylglutathione hydrolase
MDNLGYLVCSGKWAAAIDGGAVDEIITYLRDNDLRLRCVTNTHTHWDHTCGNAELLRRTGAEFVGAHPSGRLELDGELIRIIRTPGHTPDSVCFHFNGTLISGDTLFNGKVGRCFTGDTSAFFESIEELMKLPDTTILYAGHDYVEEYLEFARDLEPDNREIDRYLETYDPDHIVSTLGDERRVDPFLRLDEPSIVRLLQDRGLPTLTRLQRWESLLSLM